MNQVIDFSTLTWVKNELDETLKEARQSLEAYVEDNSDTAQLEFLLAHLHQVYGTLQMVELYGAALLAEEMEQVARALSGGSVARPQDAFEVLMRALLQLPDYLDRLIAGNQDIPLVLLPLLNDLRAVRGANLLSENAMFSPDIDTPLPTQLPEAPQGFSGLAAKDLRHRFQLGLLGWFRGRDLDRALGAVVNVLDTLLKQAQDDRVRRLWWVAGAVADAVRRETLEGSVALKRLFGQVDRELRRLASEGEQAMVESPSDDLLRNLLFYAGRARDEAGRVAEVRQLYRLDELLPSDEQMAAAREGLAGQNADLFATVAAAVKEELARLKDQLDIALRGGCKDAANLREMVTSLSSLGDTLGMLSLGEARQAVLTRVEELNAHLSAGNCPPDTLMMDVASTLLFVESSVEDMGSGRRVAPAANMDEHLARSEFDQVMDVVMQEAITDLARAKDAITAYMKGDEAAQIGEVPQWFNQVKGGLLLLEEARAASIIDAAGRYVRDRMANGDGMPPEAELDSLADAVCGLEYYLESRREHRMYGDSAMQAAEKGIETLGYAGGDAAGTDETSQDPADVEATSDAAPPESPRVEEAGKAGECVAEDAAPPAADLPPTLEVAAETSIETPTEPEQTAQVPEEAGEPVEPETEAKAEDSGLSIGQGSVAGEDVPERPVQALEDAFIAEDLPPAPPSEAGEEPSAVGEEGTQGAEEDDDGLQVIGEDTDEEILEIFIEEAQEELESLNEMLPRWLANAEDEDALGTVRRSFHTLKGSGRLVGALRIGEFAWAYENMLNRVIDGTVSADESMREVLKASLPALEQLVGQVRERAPVHAPVAWLMRSAEALSRGEAMPARQPASPGMKPASRDEVTEPKAEEAEESEDVAPALPAGTEDASAARTEAWPEKEEAGATQSLPQDAPAQPLPDNDSVMDSALYEIFSTESQGHLDTLHKFVNRLQQGDGTVDEELVRALHTLHGSANMAGSLPIADLSGALERYVRRLAEAGGEVPAEHAAMFTQSIDQIRFMLDALPDGHGVPEGFAALLAQVANRRDAVEEDPAHTREKEDHTPAGSQMDVSRKDTDPSSGDAAQDTLYDDIDPELLEIFLEESEENLNTSDAALERWRCDANDRDALAELQRALHTVKGGARMAGLGPVGDLAHAMESLIIAITECGAQATAAAMEAVQRAQDGLNELLDEVRVRQPMHTVDELVHELEVLRTGLLSEQVDGQPVTRNPDEEAEAEAPERESSAGIPPEAAEEAGGADPYAEIDPELLGVFIEEATDILENSQETLEAWRAEPGNADLMAALQRELHTLKGGARMADITAIGDIAHAIESLMVKVCEGSVAPADTLFMVLQQAQDTLAHMVQSVSRHEAVGDQPELMADLEALLEGREAAVRSKPVPSRVEPVVVQQEREAQERRAQNRTTQELVRVKAGLLDNLVNYAGEISIYRSRLEQQVGAYRFNLVELEQTVARLREQLRKLEIETEAQVLFRYEREAEALEGDEDFDPLEMDRYSQMQQLSRSLVESCSDLSSLQALLDNITRESETLLLQQSRVNTELQEGLMRTRMVPFLGLAPRMRRIVRQTCQELGKQAELELSGAEGEMDRTVVDRIIAPLEHMLRNAISHGIETPEARRAAGKPETGTIRITLERESSDVLLRIADDGAGIDLGAIRRKAVERGLMEEGSTLGDNEVLQFILETGFSTASQVTQVAGRGVGMDVVNNEVKQLGGSLHIDSVRGQGTSFTIRLPFTLAINQALMIEVGEDTYAVPLSSIESIVRVRREDLENYYKDSSLKLEYAGHEYEVRHLGAELGTGVPHLENAPRRVPLLLARSGDHGVAFHVENLQGSREIVVKSVGPQISTVRGVSGATILGDGRVVMILDMVAMLRTGSPMTSVLDQVKEMVRDQNRREGITVMVVDDSITVRKVTTRLLERNDMNVISAKDGVDAVSKLQEHIPDIMLLDIEMPRMDGFELATHVRNEPRLRNIPIIMITSRTGDKHRQRAMQIGVNRYLGKPFQEGELLKTMSELLEE